MARCENIGAYNLVKELPIEDMMAVSNYLRIDQDIFKMISEQISPLIYCRDINYISINKCFKLISIFYSFIISLNTILII